MSSIQKLQLRHEFLSIFKNWSLVNDVFDAQGWRLLLVVANIIKCKFNRKWSLPKTLEHKLIAFSFSKGFFSLSLSLPLFSGGLKTTLPIVIFHPWRWTRFLFHVALGMPHLTSGWFCAQSTALCSFTQAAWRISVSLLTGETHEHTEQHLRGTN